MWINVSLTVLSRFVKANEGKTWTAAKKVKRPARGSRGSKGGSATGGGGTSKDPIADIMPELKAKLEQSLGQENDFKAKQEQHAREQTELMRRALEQSDENQRQTRAALEKANENQKQTNQILMQLMGVIQQQQQSQMK